QSIFDLATRIDKLIYSSSFTVNEIRLEVGYEYSDDPNLNIHHITKNYKKLDESEGGEKENDGEN
ncbi:phage portal protein, partial [Bacillus cereus]|nr:phage portal protein [Bacillus cereus]